MNVNCLAYIGEKGINYHFIKQLIKCSFVTINREIIQHRMNDATTIKSCRYGWNDTIAIGQCVFDETVQLGPAEKDAKRVNL